MDVSGKPVWYESGAGEGCVRQAGHLVITYSEDGGRRFLRDWPLFGGLHGVTHLLNVSHLGETTAPRNEEPCFVCDTHTHTHTHTHRFLMQPKRPQAGHRLSSPILDSAVHNLTHVKRDVRTAASSLWRRILIQRSGIAEGYTLPSSYPPVDLASGSGFVPDSSICLNSRPSVLFYITAGFESGSLNKWQCVV